jgi:4-hydroxybenzoate polyprenyltransferase
VNLDGALIRTDLVVESLFAYLGANPLRFHSLLAARSGGKARLKLEIARKTPIDPARLPYDDRVLSFIQAARNAGRRTYLASASNERHVRDVADHLDLFDGWFASTEKENLSSHCRAHRLIEAFGENGFDYIGNDRADLDVWPAAKGRIAIDPPRSVAAALKAIDPDATIIASQERGVRPWMKLLRVHQWAKNALVFVPALAAHRFDFRSLGDAALAAAAFSFAASSIYIVNDLVDLEADRKYENKRRRTLAAGKVSVRKAMIAAPAVLVFALAVGSLVSLGFVAVLIAYVALTTAYTFSLKRKMMVDIVALALLYTMRVIGGAAALSVMPSEWILAFSMFIFTSLALIKRYAELATRLDAALPDPTNRNYRKTDLGVIAALAAASGLNAVTVFALYISSDTVRHLYRHPQVLWLICPILVYWLGRALILAERRLMDDDPVEFALKDRNSLVSFAMIGFIAIVAI